MEVQLKSEIVNLKKWTGCDAVYAVYILVEMTKAKIIHVTDRNLKEQLTDKRFMDTCQNVCIVLSRGLKVGWWNVNSYQL